MPLTEFSFLFDDIAIPMWIFEIATLRIVQVNKAAVNLYGYTKNEFLSLSADDLRPASEIEAFHAYVAKLKTAGDNTRELDGPSRWKHLKKNGNHIHVEITSHFVNHQDSDCRVVVALDVTEKLHFEEELIRTKKSLEALINNTEDEIWSVDKETRYVYMNKAYRQSIAHLTGVRPKEGDYSYLHTAFGGGVIKKWKNLYARGLAGERYVIVNESTDPVTGLVLSFEISFNPIIKADGEITGVGCFARNITGRLKTEKAIIDQNERLRNIASLSSHELRRPVASMLGLINVMDRANFFNPDNKEIIEHLLTVGNEIDEVIRLIVDNTFTYDAGNKYYLP